MNKKWGCAECVRTWCGAYRWVVGLDAM